MSSRRRPSAALLAGGIILVLLAGLAVAADRWHVRQTENALLRLPADEILASAPLTAFADERGPALYADHCASCHGAKLEGDLKRGVPSLGDAEWLYGTGAVSDIEQTIQYGIRSGHPKAHNITDMPAFLRIGQLSAVEIDDVVEYLLSLSNKPHDAAAAQRGDALYQNKGNCFDCHSSDALGNPDYGAPALTGLAWNYGGDRETLRDSVINGRHGLCPAWGNELKPAAVRELAVYLHNVSQQAARRAPRG
ncbi:MAG TPA: c-type cytochrome [Steroidobacteraceae bacterium]|nr:c-type cytochrome [Steroidobacteraceae bacterium]